MKSKHYIVARYWNDDSNLLCTYAFGTQVQYGNEAQAQNFLEYVKSESSHEDWRIIWIQTDRD